jgi:hypothetical protein
MEIDGTIQEVLFLVLDVTTVGARPMVRAFVGREVAMQIAFCLFVEGRGA